MKKTAKSAISIKDLKKFYGDLVALQGIDLDIKEGEFFGLLGPNGAGKTTTINIITGLSNKTSGNISLYDFDTEKDYMEARKLIGLVPQEFNFDPFIKVEKLLLFQGGYFGMPFAQCKKRAEIILKRLDLWDRKNTVIRKLSGGMKRRVMIARALMHDPKILILDEPTAGVDVELRKDLWNLLRELNKSGKTILLTTHYIEEAEKLCEKIAIIDNGNIIACDKTQNLIDQLECESLKITVKERLIPSQVKKLQKYHLKLSRDKKMFEIYFFKNKISYDSVLKDLLKTDLKITGIQPTENKLEKIFVNMTKGVKSVNVVKAVKGVKK